MSQITLVTFPFISNLIYHGRNRADIVSGLPGFAQCYVAAWMIEGLGENGYMCMYG